ncbi:hypothetical+protein [Methylocapsa aurea]|uniref:RNA polymerase sigma factor n=1 Tax=Methylocapsa aurea TaxID=663610 RepID=UPI003D18E793
MPETKFFRDLFLRNRKDLLSFLTRRVGRADADDLLQETFARFIIYSDARTVSEPPPFLQKIAMNLVRDFARSRAAEARYIEFGDLPQDAPSAERSPLAHVEAMEKWRLVAAAIAALPPRCREVFVLYMTTISPSPKSLRDWACRKIWRRSTCAWLWCAAGRRSNKFMAADILFPPPRPTEVNDGQAPGCHLGPLGWSFHPN